MKSPCRMDKRASRDGPNGNQRIPQDSGALRPLSNPLGPIDTERYHQPQWTNDWELEHLSLVPKKSPPVKATTDDDDRARFYFPP